MENEGTLDFYSVCFYHHHDHGPQKPEALTLFAPICPKMVTTHLEKWKKICTIPAATLQFLFPHTILKDINGVTHFK